MASIIKAKLSGSTDGRQIMVSASGVIIHTAASASTTFDEIYLWAINNSSEGQILHVEWGASTTNDLISYELPHREGPQLIIPGIPLTGAASPAVVTAFVTATNSIGIMGYVNRIDQS